MIDDKMNNKETFQVLQEYDSVWQAFEDGFRYEHMSETKTIFYLRVVELQDYWKCFLLKEKFLLLQDLEELVDE